MLPIRIRHLPQFIVQNFQKQKLLRRPPVRRTVFHLCYFSCHSYFQYLYCALHSLTVNAPEVDYRIRIFNDNDQPLSANQILAIQALIPGAVVVPWPKSMGWGLAQIGTIWEAYALAVQDADPEDFVARVDSDVFFFNDTIFRAAASSDADFIGDGHFEDFKYCQGGCYFFRVAAARKVSAAIATEGLPELLIDVPVMVEDVAATHMAKRLGLTIWMTWFMMFPDEWRNSGGLSRWARWKFSCLHSVNKNKDLMLEAYERGLYQGRCPDAYKQALLTV